MKKGWGGNMPCPFSRKGRDEGLSLDMASEKRRRRWKPDWTTAYIMVLPFTVLLLGLVVYPIVWNVIISFESKGVLSLANYRQILSDPAFGRVAYNTTLWTLGSVVPQLVIGLGVAMLLNQKVKGSPFFRAVILVLPWATPHIVAALAWRWMYNDLYGVFNDLLLRVGLQPVAWLGQPDWARFSVIVANNWKGFSLSAMFYLAGLQTIPEDILEAARVDGAGRWASFRHVVLPHLRVTITLTVLLTVIFTINYFPLIFVMTRGGPAQATDTFITWAYLVGFTHLSFPGSAAISTINFLIILVASSFYVYFLTRPKETGGA
jgi:multiple sugar transport system permease protein